MVGNCVAVNEATQARAHMRGAMRAGATPREVMEVILQSAPNFGMPSMISSMKAFVKIMRDEGRAAEIGDPPERDD
jgi:alkylhydroperoxidase/carboxymuconolactone decarboxylase family protein YurZ